MAHGIDDEFTVDLQYSEIRIVWQAVSAWLILRVEQARFGVEALWGPLDRPIKNLFTYSSSDGDD